MTMKQKLILSLHSTSGFLYYKMKANWAALIPHNLNYRRQISDINKSIRVPSCLDTRQIPSIIVKRTRNTWWTLIGQPGRLAWRWPSAAPQTEAVTSASRPAAGVVWTSPWIGAGGFPPPGSGQRTTGTHWNGAGTLNRPRSQLTRLSDN